MPEAETIPFLEVGGQGPTLHFSHANGYPPLAYRSLLEPFVIDHRVIASLHRPLWESENDPEQLESWTTLGKDLESLLSAEPEPVISIGHSMGAAAIIMAAVRRPELFRKIVLIEPVLMPRGYFLLLRLFRRQARQRLPLIKRTLNRKDRWSSKQDVFNHFRPKRVFADISDEVLWDYVEHGTAETESGARKLVYSKEWEAHCYTRAYSLWKLLPQLKLPVLAIRGANSDTVSHSAWVKWQAQSPMHDYVEIDKTGHLLPLEMPDLLAQKIREWI